MSTVPKSRTHDIINMNSFLFGDVYLFKLSFHLMLLICYPSYISLLFSMNFYFTEGISSLANMYTQGRGLGFLYMPFIKLRRFLGSGIPCISVLKTCVTLIRLRSCIFSLRINPTVWDHFIDLLNLPNTSLFGPLDRKGVGFSFLTLLCTPWKCNCCGTNKQEDIQWKL